MAEVVVTALAAPVVTDGAPATARTPTCGEPLGAGLASARSACERDRRMTSARGAERRRRRAGPRRNAPTQRSRDAPQEASGWVPARPCRRLCTALGTESRVISAADTRTAHRDVAALA